jgi:magnesium transporter
MLHRATGPLVEELKHLSEDEDTEMITQLLRLRGPLQRLSHRLDGNRELLSSLLEVSITVVGQKISAWGAILIVPTLIASVFGMNFTQEWWTESEHGFEVMIAILLLVSGLLYLWFKQ